MYQNGSWKEGWSAVKTMYLYKQGDQCTSVTGGWTTSGFQNSTGGFAFTYMYIDYLGYSGAQWYFYTNNPIPQLKNESTILHVKGYNGGLPSGSGAIVVSGNYQVPGGDNRTCRYVNMLNYSGNFEAVASINTPENISMDQHITFVAHANASGSYSCNLRVYEIWIEYRP